MDKPKVRIKTPAKRKERGILSLHTLYRRATASDRAPPVPLTRQQVLSLRQEIYAAVVAALPHVTAAVAGEGGISLSNQQVALFRTLLAKVLPDLQATYAQVNVLTQSLDRMSREELEAIASGQEVPHSLGEGGQVLEIISQVKDLPTAAPEPVAVSCPEGTPSPPYHATPPGAGAGPPATPPVAIVTPLPPPISEQSQNHGQPPGGPDAQ